MTHIEPRGVRSLRFSLLFLLGWEPGGDAVWEFDMETHDTAVPVMLF